MFVQVMVGIHVCARIGEAMPLSSLSRLAAIV
jgi:hypothetical protein